MTLEQLRASLREKHGALPPLRDKAMADGASDDDVSAFEAGLKACEDIEKKISLAERAEELEAKASTVAVAPAARPDDIRIPAIPKQEYSLDRKMAIVAAGVIKAGKNGDPLKILEAEGYGQFVAQLTAEMKIIAAAQGKAVNTLVTSEGGVLVPTPLDGGLVLLLRAQSTFLDANPTRVQLINGQFNQARGATGATAAYTAQGALKPVSTPTFDAIAMQAKKLAGIVPVTNEARKWTVGNIEQYVRNDLRSALATTLDLNAYLGTGAGASPVGILNKTGVQTVTGTFVSATVPTLAELDGFATAMILKLTTQNIYANDRWRWLMSYRTAMKLAGIRVGSSFDGDLAFPEMDLGRTGGPRWKGFPVIVTSQIPTNGGGTTDETTIALVDFTDVLYGEEAGIEMKMSDQATLDVDGAGTLVHLWQQNMFALLAESEHDFGLRRAKAVVKATIRW